MKRINLYFKQTGWKNYSFFRVKFTQCDFNTPFIQYSESIPQTLILCYEHSRIKFSLLKKKKHSSHTFYFSHTVCMKRKCKNFTKELRLTELEFLWPDRTLRCWRILAISCHSAGGRARVCPAGVDLEFAPATNTYCTVTHSQSYKTSLCTIIILLSHPQIY